VTRRIVRTLRDTAAFGALIAVILSFLVLA
jgi:hypothetical protein